jgi:hypothetical protein
VWSLWLIVIVGQHFFFSTYPANQHSTIACDCPIDIGQDWSTVMLLQSESAANRPAGWRIVIQIQVAVANQEVIEFHKDLVVKNKRTGDLWYYWPTGIPIISCKCWKWKFFYTVSPHLFPSSEIFSRLCFCFSDWEVTVSMLLFRLHLEQAQRCRLSENTKHEYIQQLCEWIANLCMQE